MSLLSSQRCASGFKPEVPKPGTCAGPAGVSEEGSRGPGAGQWGCGPGPPRLPGPPDRGHAAPGPPPLPRRRRVPPVTDSVALRRRLRASRGAPPPRAGARPQQRGPRPEPPAARRPAQCTRARSRPGGPARAHAQGPAPSEGRAQRGRPGAAAAEGGGRVAAGRARARPAARPPPAPSPARVNAFSRHAAGGGI